MLVTKTNAFSTDFVDFHGASYWSSASELVAGVGGMGRLFYVTLDTLTPK